MLNTAGAHEHGQGPNKYCEEKKSSSISATWLGQQYVHTYFRKQIERKTTHWGDVISGVTRNSGAPRQISKSSPPSHFLTLSPYSVPYLLLRFLPFSSSLLLPLFPTALCPFPSHSSLPYSSQPFPSPSLPIPSPYNG